MMKFIAVASILVAMVAAGSAGVYRSYDGYGHRSYDTQRVTIVPDRQTTGLDSKRYQDAFLVTQTAADVAASNDARPRAYGRADAQPWPTINDMGTRYLNDAWGYVAPRVRHVAKVVHRRYYGAPITGQGRAPLSVRDCTHVAFPQCGD